MNSPFEEEFKEELPMASKVKGRKINFIRKTGLVAYRSPWDQLSEITT